MGAGEMLANTWLAGRPHASSMLASACRAARTAPLETTRRPAPLQPRICAPAWRSLAPPRQGLAGDTHVASVRALTLTLSRARTRAVGNGGTRSCRRSISTRYAGLRMSTRVLTACAILTYAGPRRSTAPRTCAARARLAAAAGTAGAGRSVGFVARHASDRRPSFTAQDMRARHPLHALDM